MFNMINNGFVLTSKNNLSLFEVVLFLDYRLVVKLACTITCIGVNLHWKIRNVGFDGFGVNFPVVLFKERNLAEK